MEPTGVRYLPGRRALTLARAGAASGWGLVCASTVATAVSLARNGRQPGWRGSWGLAALGASLFPALLLTGRARRLAELEARAPLGLAEQRHHGELPAAATAGSRSLRSLGADGATIAARTDAQLAALTVLPGVRIFRGVRAGRPPRVVATHAVSAGPMVVLVESVAWPPGNYQLDSHGRVACDREPTGQHTAGLVEAVATCRARLPRYYQVRGLVSVHRTAPGEYLLPLPDQSVSWTFSDDLVETLLPRLARYGAWVSRYAVAALTGKESSEWKYS